MKAKEEGRALSLSGRPTFKSSPHRLTTRSLRRLNGSPLPVLRPTSDLRASAVRLCCCLRSAVGLGFVSLSILHAPILSAATTPLPDVLSVLAAAAFLFLSSSGCCGTAAPPPVSVHLQSPPASMIKPHHLVRLSSPEISPSRHLRRLVATPLAQSP